MDMRRFYIEPPATAKPVLTIKGPEAHHIKNVLRLKPGDCIKLFDGTGFEYEAVVATIDAQKVEVKIQRKVQAASGAGVQIIVAQSFLKEKKMDDLVRKLCELGIAGWIPFFSQRAIPRPDKKRLAGRTQRWKRIATEALKQCRRMDMPQIHEAFTFEEVLDFSRTCDLKIVFWENETIALRRDMGSNTLDSLNKILVMVGPEGGFTAQEIEMARHNGFVVAGLGPRILRAETATIAAAALIQYIFGDMGRRDLPTDP
jgi:16S rRNA (uracil1498-N3)-methyltransferase